MSQNPEPQSPLSLTRLAVFVGVFLLMNLVFIPLMALYGLRVCPVLNVAGFWFGCAYVGTYIFLVGFLNLVLIFALWKDWGGWISPGRSFLIFAGAYFAATLVALVVLQVMLKTNHLTETSRAPEILLFASLLLGITQSYGLSWVFQNHQGPSSTTKTSTDFKKMWALHSLRTLFPIVTGLAVLIHFQISQSIGFNDGRTAVPVSHDQMILQTSLVIAFVLVWLMVTLGFHFLSEGQYVKGVQKHLKELAELKTDYRSPASGAWGMWSLLFLQLNDFSKALEERTRLLKSFSRFVSAGVAKQALKSELKHTMGMAQETTILISDIRNFTSISEDLNPHQTVDLLNQYFTGMLDVMVRFEINVDKFIGDGILAYVETKTQKEENATEENNLAVGGALAMLERLVTLNLSFERQKLPQLKIGIGIYRGPVVIGLIGSENKLQYTIIGDAVNRTSRLEGLCKELGVSILISQDIWQTLAPDLQSKFKSCGSHAVKGLTENLITYGT